MTEAKQKLTLSVDSDTVERAKALGINISELTGKVLRSFALKPEDTEEDALQKQRELLFDGMVPMLKKLGAEVHVGVVDDPSGNPDEDYLDVVLTRSGKPMVLAPDETGDLYHEDPSAFGRIFFDPPNAIVDHFMEAIAAAKAKRKEDVASYILARKIVEVVTQREKEGGSPRLKPNRPTRSGRRTKKKAGGPA